MIRSLLSCISFLVTSRVESGLQTILGYVVRLCVSDFVRDCAYLLVFRTEPIRAQFIEKVCGTVCGRVSDWTCFGKTSSEGCNAKLGAKMANKNRNYPKRVRTPENIVRLQESLEQSPTKSQRRLSVQVGIKRTLCRNIIKKDLHLYAYKFTLLHPLKRPGVPVFRSKFSAVAGNKAKHIYVLNYDIDAADISGVYFLNDNLIFHIVTNKN
ncbi:hypothetical protein ANN_22064 [Periplaneta americana]|uniref:Uncharacterized protein n=1 Tax=Periplaneta americana TaxID=6978 RepID=A0ABQ8S7M0_PERAM|nr:hypothetical protein ANN_22064 [Periplaneta americana]